MTTEGEIIIIRLLRAILLEMLVEARRDCWRAGDNLRAETLKEILGLASDFLESKADGGSTRGLFPRL